MKKQYIVPALEIQMFNVEDIITESIVNVLEFGFTDEELGEIKFDDGNTLESINYKKFFK